MIIKSQDVQLNSSETMVKYQEKNESLDVWDRNKSIHISTKDEKTEASVHVFQQNQGNSPALVDISDEGFAKLMDSANLKSNEQKNSLMWPIMKTPESVEDAEDSMTSEMRMIKLLFESAFGIKINFLPDVFKASDKGSSASPAVDLSNVGVSNEGGEAVVGESQTEAQPEALDAEQIQELRDKVSVDAAAARNENVRRPAALEGWGVRYSYSDVNYEKNAVSFSAEGEVTTEDGRRINFNASMELSNEKLSEVRIEYKAGDALIDPLALNFDGKGVQLTDEKMQFDINSDGSAETVSFVQQGSGFLALDNNENGVVDNGTELFGPQSNQGFLELKAYDGDQNNWIDENDGVFSKLRIWSRDAEGNDILSSLKEYNVGAIYLGSAKTSYAMSEGMLKETGVFLNEDGSSHLIQEVDLKA